MDKLKEIKKAQENLASFRLEEINKRIKKIRRCLPLAVDCKWALEDIDFIIEHLNSRLKSARQVIQDVLDTDGQPEYVENMRKWLKRCD